MEAFHQLHFEARDFCLTICHKCENATVKRENAMTIKLRNGIFLAPFHPVDEDPTLCIQRDLDLIEHLDRLGYEEAWVGEHHSAGFEIISSPEIFIAAAGERTKRIRLGTGVVSLPYHNPLMAANRILQLDHQTRGPRDVRRRSRPSALRRVFDGHRSVDATRPYGGIDRSDPAPVQRRARHAEIRLVHVKRRDLSVQPLHLATSRNLLWHRASRHRAANLRANMASACCAWRQHRPAATTRSPSTGKIANKTAAEHGRKMDPEELRLVGPVHIAETREKAFENCKFGFEQWRDYFAGIGAVAGRAGDSENRPSKRWSKKAASWSARPTMPSRRSAGCRTSRANSAASCSSRTIGRISKTPRNPTSCGSAM